jgi:hypothetical protein
MAAIPLKTIAPLHLRLAGRSAIFSGAIGIVAFGALMAYLATQFSAYSNTGVMPLAGKVLLSVDYAGVAIQALLMIPAVITFDRLGEWKSPRFGKWAKVVGVSALVVVAIVRLLIFVSPSVSDILFMAPMGFVGAWLLAVNGFTKNVFPRWLRFLGLVAGAGLTVVGLNFFFNGGMAVFTRGPWAYADDVPFHKGLALGGLPGFILFPIWGILVGIRLARLERQ